MHTLLPASNPVSDHRIRARDIVSRLTPGAPLRVLIRNRPRFEEVSFIRMIDDALLVTAGARAVTRMIAWHAIDALELVSETPKDNP